MLGDLLDVPDPHVHHGLKRVEEMGLGGVLAKVLDSERTASVLHGPQTT